MMEDWAEIRRLHRSEGMAIKAIARRSGLARNTVRAALAARIRRRGMSVLRWARGAMRLEPAIRGVVGGVP